MDLYKLRADNLIGVLASPDQPRRDPPDECTHLTGLAARPLRLRLTVGCSL